MERRKAGVYKVTWLDGRKTTAFYDPIYDSYQVGGIWYRASSFLAIENKPK